jgi:hypothetical protein
LLDMCRRQLEVAVLEELRADRVKEDVGEGKEEVCSLVFIFLHQLDLKLALPFESPIY